MGRGIMTVRFRQNDLMSVYVVEGKLLLVRRSGYITSSGCSGGGGRKCSGKAVEEAKVRRVRIGARARRREPSVEAKSPPSRSAFDARRDSTTRWRQRTMVQSTQRAVFPARRRRCARGRALQRRVRTLESAGARRPNRSRSSPRRRRDAATLLRCCAITAPGAKLAARGHRWYLDDALGG
jgi:hypothetical protein